MDSLTPEQRRKNMQAIKSKNTKAEIKLSKALWHLGYRYRKNSKYIYGKPDISFKKYKIAIFIDGEFFHGYDWQNKKQKIQTNRVFWIQKIERNIQRDIEVNNHLISRGWVVLRFWAKEVNSNIEKCTEKIENAVKSRLITSTRTGHQ